MNSKSNSAAYVYAGIAVLLWASSFPAVKFVLGWYTPGSLVLFRFIIASIVMFAAAFVKKARLPACEDIPFALAGGAIGIFVYMFLFNTGLDMVKSGIGSFIIATSPIFTLIFSVFILKEKLRRAAVIGVIISGLGLLLIAVSQVREFSLNYGLLVLLAASLCTSAYNIIQRKISFKYTAVECTSYSIISATALMFIFTPELIRDFPTAPPLANWLIIYLGIFPAALSYLFWNAAIGKAKNVTSVSNFLYLVPFLATTLAYLFLGEVLSPLDLVGGAAIIAGMVFASRKMGAEAPE